MKSRNGVLLFTLAISVASLGAVSAQSPTLVQGRSIDVDAATGHTIAKKATIADRHLRIDAGQAQYTIDQTEEPRVVDLSDGVTIRSDDGLTVRTSNATYYAELQTVSSHQLTVNRDVTPFAVVTYTCQSGTLFANGVSTGGGSACHGYSYISCGGSGGNMVTMVRLKQACSDG